MRSITTLLATIALFSLSDTEVGVSLEGEGLPVEQTPAELVLFADVVWTLNPERPQAEAVAVSRGRITAVGSASEIEGMVGSDTRVLRLHPGVVVPGLVDAHCHLLGFGLGLERLDLVGTSSYEEILDLVAGKVRSTPPGQWILGRGWDQNDWPQPHWPDKEALDRVSRDNPVLLRRIDGHAALVNSRALELAGIGESTLDPPDGKILRDSGAPTGVLIDGAVELVQRVVPRPTKDDKRAAILKAAELCLAAGLVGVHEAGVSAETLGLYAEMADAGELPIRVYAMADGEDPALERILEAGPVLDRGGRFTLRSVKLYADGALGSRGAALLEPYSDDPDNRGILMAEEDSLAALTARALRRGFQVCVHAIGDRANRVVLDAYEKALEETGMPGRRARLRIEHAQILSPEDIPRFAELGVIASMQPTHCTSDMPWAPQRLGAARLAGAYAWATLLSSGAVLAAGSDFPVESHEPLLGFYAAVTRRSPEGTPPGGWMPQEKLTREQALSAFTAGAAYAAFEEEAAGTIEPGKRADFTVFDADIMRLEPSRILDSHVLMTIVDGTIAYRRE